MPHRLREFVAARARWRCEYCQAPEALFNSPCDVDHIRPRERDGSDEAWNLALACRSCNGSKHVAIEALDPLTGRSFRLFNPRTDTWDDHFSIGVTTAEVRGVTSIGRATIDRLRMNDARQRQARRIWIQLFSFPDDPPDIGGPDG